MVTLTRTSIAHHRRCGSWIWWKTTLLTTKWTVPAVLLMAILYLSNNNDVATTTTKPASSLLNMESSTESSSGTERRQRVVEEKDEPRRSATGNHNNNNGPPPQQSSTKSSPVKVAHVISLIKCHKARRVTGFLDALVILRHSIHQNSMHRDQWQNGPQQPSDATVLQQQPKSNYSYQMIAIVHESGGCDQHVPILSRLGYQALVVPPLVNISTITTNDWYRDHVKHENCCGDAEFVKLYAYTLMEYPIVVHWDLDVLLLTPMDDLFDAMIYDKDSVQGRTARQKLQRQPPQDYQTPLPDQIDAFITRDVTSSNPWEQIRAVQGGFVVARPNLQHLELYKQFILEANYTRGRGPTSGWGGMGYGGFQGAMAYQGVLAYFYDQIYPGHSVELDVCRWNQVVADVIHRGPGGLEHLGQCKQYPVHGNYTANTIENGQCEDCRVLPIEETRSVHYTACNKPWDCAIPHPRTPRNKERVLQWKELTNITTCGLLFCKYFDVRYEIESWIATVLQQKDPPNPQGDLHPEYFRGYCKGRGTYLSMQDTIPDDFNMKQVYGF